MRPKGVPPGQSAGQKTKSFREFIRSVVVQPSQPINPPPLATRLATIHLQLPQTLLLQPYLAFHPLLKIVTL